MGLVLWGVSLCHILFSNHIAEEEKTGRLTRVGLL